MYKVINGKLQKVGIKPGYGMKRGQPIEPISYSSGRYDDPPLKADKGQYGGHCNRTACQDPGAFWYHHSTQAHYCTSCARMLNHANHYDAMELYGHELCTMSEQARIDYDNWEPTC